jgi:putative oxidoreductase
LCHLAERIACAKVALASRLAVADVFWPSGQTKVKGLSIREEATVAAYLSTVAEGVFPVLLFFGLASRLSAGTARNEDGHPVLSGGWPEHISRCLP